MLLSCCFLSCGSNEDSNESWYACNGYKRSLEFVPDQADSPRRCKTLHTMEIPPLANCGAASRYVLSSMQLAFAKCNNMTFHRISSALFGVLLAVAGLVAASYVEIEFKAGLLSGMMGMLVPGVLMLSAFYMAFRLLRFATTGKK